MVLINQFINFKIGGVTVAANSTELNYNAGVAAGTAAANKTLVLNSNKDIFGINHLSANQLTGTIQTTAQPNITSLGTLTSLAVTGQNLIGVSSDGILRIKNFSGFNYIQSALSTTTGSAASLFFTNYGQDTSTSARVFTIRYDGRIGVQTINPSRQLTVNHPIGECLRLTYNAHNGSPTIYSDFDVNSSGDLSITTTGEFTTINKKLKVNDAISNFATNGLLIRSLNQTLMTGITVKKEVISNINISNYNPSGLTDNFTVEISGYIKPVYTETYTFYVSHDDNCRLFIDGKLIFQDWSSGLINGAASDTISLIANTWYPIYMQVSEGIGGQQAKLEWQSTSQTREFIPSSRFAWDDKIPEIFRTTNIIGDLIIHNDSTELSNRIKLNVDINGNLDITPLASTSTTTINGDLRTYFDIRSNTGSSTVQQILRFNSHSSSRGGGIEWVNDSNNDRYFFGRVYQGGSVISKLTYNVALSGEDPYRLDSNVNVLVIQDDGKIGINTDSPVEKLDVNDGNIRISERNAYADDRYIYTQWSDGLNDHSIGFEFDYYTGSGGTSTTHSRLNFVSNAELNENIYDSGKQTMMSVLSNGKIGIGTNNPSEVLHIKSPGPCYLKLEGDSDNVNESDTAGILISQDNGGTSSVIQMIGSVNEIATGTTANSLLLAVTNSATNDHQIHFATDNSVKMTLTKAGNLGIGTTNPETLLHLTHTGGTHITLESTFSTSHSHILYKTNGDDWEFGARGTNASNAPNSMYWYNSGYKMVLRNDAKLGINTINPDKQLEVNSTTGDCLRLTYNDNTGGAANYCDFTVSSSGDLTINPSGGDTYIDGVVRIGDVINESNGIIRFLPFNGNQMLLQCTTAFLSGSACDVAIVNGFQTVDNSARVFMVKADGKVGIQSNAPDKQLEINSTTGQCLRLTYNDKTGGAANYCDFTVSSSGSLTIDASGDDIWIENDVIIDVTDVYAFVVRPNNGGGNDVLVVNTSNKRVGINGAPSYPLHVFHNDAKIAEFVSSEVGGACYLEIKNQAGTRAIFGPDGSGFSGGSTSNVNVANWTNGNLVFFTNATKRGEFTSGGDLLLENDLYTDNNAFIGDTVGSSHRLVLRSSAAEVRLFAHSDSVNYYQTSGDIFMKANGINQTSNPNLYLHTNGKVGIQTKTPAHMLDIQNAGTNNYIRIGSGFFGTTYAGILFSDPGVDNGWHLRLNNLTNNLELGYQDNTPTFTNLMTFDRATKNITFAERIGIGGSSPVFNLDIRDSGTNTELRILRTDINGVDLRLKAQDVRARITYDNGPLWFDYNNLGGLTLAMTETGDVGIGEHNPGSKLHIKQSAQDNTGGIRLEKSSANNFWSQFYDPLGHLSFNKDGTDLGYVASNGTHTQMNFTGQHRSFTENTEINNNIDKYIGLIVSVTGEYKNMNNEELTVNDALPIVDLSNIIKDKKVFGVISAKEDEDRVHQFGIFATYVNKEEGDERLFINSVGEGMVWVCNKIEKVVEKKVIVKTKTINTTTNIKDSTVITETIEKSSVNTITKTQSSLLQEEDVPLDDIGDDDIIIEEELVEDEPIVNRTEDIAPTEVDKVTEENEEITEETIYMITNDEEYERGAIFESGDFITTSSISGYGMKQDDDLFHSYTFGKITQDCDFSNPDRYVDENGNEISESEFDKKGGYKCCFVGCVYYCG